MSGRSNLSILPVLILVVAACHKTDTTAPPSVTTAFSVSGTKILHNSTAVQLIGANAFNVFGPGGIDMKDWNIDISREFIGNAKETPITGGAIKDGNGAYLYALQTLADSNRKYNRVTVFCGFGWDGSSNTLFTGTRPTQTHWWNEYKTILRQWAIQFKDQPDVWLETWNEPYRYDRADGYTDNIWMNDMNELVSIIRNAGNNNIILVPCAEQGQDESVLINKGASFLTGKQNILFDIHAYEKWLLDANKNIGMRLTLLQQTKLPLIFGETAPLNAGVLMNPQPFLDSIYSRGISVCAWTWKYATNDKDALLNDTGQPNNNGNNNWGSTYRDLAGRPRKP
jgi:mannan endo-1,4-beta-mannosidase